MERTAVISLCVQLLLLIPGLISYVVVFIGLVLVFKSTKNTFYLLLISLGVADIIYLLETLFYSIPCIILQEKIFGELFERVVGHVDTLTWFLQCSQILFITINRLRFVGCANFQTFDDVFSLRKTLGWICILWIFSGGMIVTSEMTDCRKFFNESAFYWNFNCTNENTANIGILINQIISGLFCVSSGLLYAITWILLKIKKNLSTSEINGRRRISSTRLSNEISFLIQASAISTCLLLNYIGFWIISRLGATILIQFFAIANASVDAYIYLIFNKSLRNHIKKFIVFRKERTSSSSAIFRIPKRRETVESDI